MNKQIRILIVGTLLLILSMAAGAQTIVNDGAATYNLKDRGLRTVDRIMVMPYTDTAVANSVFLTFSTSRKAGAMIVQDSTIMIHNGTRWYSTRQPAGSAASVTLLAPSGWLISGNGTDTITISLTGNSSTQYVNGAGGLSLVANLPVSTATATALAAKQDTLWYRHLTLNAYREVGNVAIGVDPTVAGFGSSRLRINGPIWIHNAPATPDPPSTGGMLFVQGDTLKYLGASGTITNLAMP